MAMLAQLELETLEETRSWLANNPDETVDSLWEYLDDWHSEHIVDTIMQAALIHGPIWAGEKVAEGMGILAEQAEDVEKSAQLNKRASYMAGDMSNH